MDELYDTTNINKEADSMKAFVEMFGQDLAQVTKMVLNDVTSDCAGYIKDSNSSVT